MAVENISYIIRHRSMIVKLGNNDEEMLQMLQEDYGLEVMSRLTVFR
jgi:hypothetical protein